LLKNIFIKLDNIIERVGNWGLLSSGLIITVMSLLSVYGVARRYLFHNPEPYSYELSTLFLAASGVLAVSGLQRYRRHLRVDFCANYFSPVLQVTLLDIVGPLLALFYVSIMVWQSWNNAIYSFGVHETSQNAWEEPIWPIKLIIPITLFWLCLVLLAQIVHGAITLKKGNVKPPVIGQETNAEEPPKG
jgi:TRAP-type mannitol/chloroaromatic compound transport system permease small subunit